MMPQRTISIRGWLISGFVLLVLVGTGVMMALLYGIREALVEREGRIVFRQLADHQQAEIEAVLAPAEGILLTLRDWLVSGELEALDQAGMNRKLGPLVGARGSATVFVQQHEQPAVSFNASGAALPPLENGLKQARLLAEGRTDGNREGQPDIACTWVESGGTAWIQMTAVVWEKEGAADAAAVLMPVEAIERANARLRHRPEVIGFWLWGSSTDAAAEAEPRPSRPTRAGEPEALAQLVRLWQSTPADRHETVLAFVSGGDRYRGTVRPCAGLIGLPIFCGVVAPESILLPAFRELTPSICIVALMGLVLAVCVGWVMSRRLRRPLESATAEILRISTGESVRPYWPRTRIRELWQLLSAVEDLGGSPRVPSAQVPEEPRERHATAHALQKWADREHPAPLADHAPSAHVYDSGHQAPGQDGAHAVSEEAPPAALVLALETARQQLRFAREELETAHGHLSTAGARDRLHRQHLERLRATLVGLSRIDMRQARDAQARRRRFAAVAAEAIGATRASLWIFEDNRSRLRLAATCDRADSLGTLPESLSRERFKSFFTAIETETVILCAEMASAPYPGVIDEWMGQTEVTSFAAVPLVYLGDLVGLFLVERGGEPRPWTSDDEALLLAVGTMAASLVALNEGPAVPDILSPVPSSATRLDQAVNRGAGIVWETDSIGCITFIAGAVRDVYGFGPEELRGKPLTCLAEHPEAAADLDRLMALLSGEPCVPYTCTHRRKDGTLVRMLVSARPIIGENGGTTGASGTAILLESIA